MKTTIKNIYKSYSDMLFNSMIVSALILLTAYNLYTGVSDDKILSEGFKSTGAKLKNIEISCCGKINSNYIGRDKLRKYTGTVCKKLTSKCNFDIQYSQAKGVRRAIYLEAGEKLNNSLMVMAESIRDSSSTKNESYIISYNTIKNINDIGKIIKQMKKAYIGFKINPSVTICISGEFHDKLNSKDKTTITNKVMGIVGGRIIDKIGDGQIVSTTAYTPRISDSVYSGNQKVNLNISYDYDEIQKKTNIFIATPIIPDEY